GVFGVVEMILDDLEDHVIAGHREYEHHHAALPSGNLEFFTGESQMIQQVAIELRFAVLVIAERDIELARSLARHHAPQKVDQVVGPRYFYVEVGVGEAEQDADAVLVQE